MIKHNPPSPEPLHRAIARFGQATVLVVGDFILDRFVNGVIERISPEAPIPVLHGRGETSTMGGAGNVVANIVSLGAAAVPVSVIGADLAGDSLVRMLRELGADTAGLAQ
ncbi:bifunctional heptose 7-phosphate kinase/heptose 1-phosphate adenyltransferase, partial [Mesorhizobium sp. M7A.F.Ca.CA.002.15.1.1]